MVARTAKPKTVWQISRVAKKAIYLGQVEAADAETAIRMAIKKFDIDPSTKTAWRRAGS